MTQAHFSRKKMLNIPSKVDSGLDKDANGKYRVRPNAQFKKFKKMVMKNLQEPPQFPENHPKLKDATIISTKGNLSGIVYGKGDESPLPYAHQ